MSSGGVDGQLLTDLFARVRTGARTFPPEIEELLSGSRSLPQKDPNWPTLTYLLGEAHRLRGETEHARDAFQELASWGASDHPNGPYNDTWGGSGLAIVGLWRWLQILDEHGPVDPVQVDRVLEVASQLQETRLYWGMVQTGLLAALPGLEEDVARRLAHVAWNNKRPEAVSLFLDFLTIDSSHQLDPMDQKIQSEILRRELVDPERLQLFRARRLLGLVKTREQQERAAEMLTQLWDNRQWPADVRAEAGYEWANYYRRQRDRQQLVEVLTEVLELAGDQSVAEKALYRRGLVHNRGRREQDTEFFRADMLELLRRFPAGQLGDDALFQLASAYLFDADLDNALSNYKKLQSLAVPHDYQDSAYYLPALGLIGRGRESDLDLAKQLLDEYLKHYPDGVFRLRCLFWQGRIAEKRDHSERARDLFQQVIEEAPYDYYAVRARMHLEEGIGAIGKDLPDFNSQTQRDLAAAYQESRVDTQLVRSSPYHDRLQVAQGTGLYRQLLEVERSLNQRLDDIPLQQLDSDGLTPAAALLLAFRQDALAAKDSPTPRPTTGYGWRVSWGTRSKTGLLPSR
jgi:tetratricopeptide (TPR) repeat protein